MRDWEGYSPLGVAINKKQTDVAIYLLEHGCTLDNEQKQHLMLQACGQGELQGRLDVVKKLVEVYKFPTGKHQFIHN